MGGGVLAHIDGRFSEIAQYMHHVNYIPMCRFGCKMPSGIA